MKNVYTVSQVNGYIKNIFVKDMLLGRISIKGEVSNCKYHTSGHIYFTLKDRTGQLSCVMFAGQRTGLAFRMSEGQNVVVSGSVKVYERDGKYQLYADKIELDGTGQLYERLEQLKTKLLAEGLFAPEHKKAIPTYPKIIGIVTASTGAALQDVCNIAARRNPYIQLVLCPAQVQGFGAAKSVTEAIRRLDGYGVDVILVVRGGGSIEDLWAFQEEEVARAVFECKTPVISGVGHETDLTLIDYVADLRAPTPSAAAELAVYEWRALSERLASAQGTMKKRMSAAIDAAHEQILIRYKRLSYFSPKCQIAEKRQHLDNIQEIMQRNMLAVLEQNRRRTAASKEVLQKKMQTAVEEKKRRLAIAAARMKGLSPLSRISSGYAYIAAQNGRAVKSTQQVKTGDNLTISLKDGVLFATVTEKFHQNIEKSKENSELERNWHGEGKK